MSLAEQQKRTAHAFIDGYNSWTIDGLLAPRSDDRVHAMLPSSLNRPERNNEDYKVFFAHVAQVMSNFNITILKLINDPEQHMAVIHGTGHGETPVGEYKNEYAFFLYFTEDGRKVRRVEEFVDTAFVGGFFPRLEEYMKAKQ